MTKCFTGLPSVDVLKTVYDFVEKYVSIREGGVVTKMEQFVAVLMKLHLNVCEEHLAYHFKVSQSTRARQWKKWIDSMYVSMKPLIRWPD